MKIAHLGHTELYVANFEAAREFSSKVLGLTISDEDENTVYLRAWQDWEHHTMTLRRADHNGLSHIAWRVETPESLEQYARHFERWGVAYEWLPAEIEPGQGEVVRFTTPGGIPMELYWQMATWQATHPARASNFPSFPEKFPLQGIAPRRVDHANVMVNDVAAEQTWLTELLGIKHRYYVDGDDGQRQGSWLSVTNQSHDIAVMRNFEGSGGLLHHHAYFVDSGEELLRAATLVAQYGGKIEWGPGRHATSGAMFLYFFEPGGNRLEIWTAGMLIFPPDWQPLHWDPEIGRQGFDMWGSKPPRSYLVYGSPPVKERQVEPA